MQVVDGVEVVVRLVWPLELKICKPRTVGAASPDANGARAALQPPNTTATKITTTVLCVWCREQQPATAKLLIVLDDFDYTTAS